MLIGYNVMTLLTQAFVWLLPQFYGDKLGNIGDGVLSSFCCIDLIAKFLKKRYVVYVACGLKRTIIFILCALMLLLTWVFHIGDYRNRSDSSPEDNKCFTFGTWTFVIILIWFLLWLIKSCVLLYWEAQAVNERLHTNISKIGKQLYILVMLSNDHYVRTTTQGCSEREDQPTCPLSCYNSTPPIEKKPWGAFEVDTIDRAKVKKILTDGRKTEDVSIYEIQRAVDIFSAAQDTLSKGSILDKLGHLHGDYSVEIDTYEDFYYSHLLRMPIVLIILCFIN